MNQTGESAVRIVGAVGDKPSADTDAAFASVDERIAAFKQPEWTKVSAPFSGRDGDTPPPYPLGRDPRTPDCKHDWNAEWGRKGERQRLCRHCERWIWERAWWPESA